MNRALCIVVTVLVACAVAAVGAGILVWSGAYNIGADAPHTRPVVALMQALRNHSIRAHAQGIKVPDLTGDPMILEGAGHYAAMCTGCHLKPGMSDSEIRPGLYPQPPNLVQVRVDPRDAFWVIKHGVKMSAMPAWGATHDDATIWNMVAFVSKLPDMTPAQYDEIVAKAPPDDDMGQHGHDHGAGSHEHDHAAAHGENKSTHDEKDAGSD